MTKFDEAPPGDRPSIKVRLSAVADVVTVPVRTLRRLIKLHRQTSGSVPHGKCYALKTLELAPLMRQLGLRYAANSSTTWAIVLAAPSPREAKRLGKQETDRRESRLGFHAAIHVAFGRLAERGRFDQKTVRARVRQLGQAEFEEIRRLLARDERLFREDDDQEVYVEFAASFLELNAFAPELVAAEFPGLAHLQRVEELLGTDIDVSALETACGVHEIPPSVRPLPGDQREATVVDGPLSSSARLGQRWVLGAARRARNVRRHARSAVLAARVIESPDKELRTQGEELLNESVRTLSEGLARAEGEPENADAWMPAVRLLVLRASARRLAMAGPEARVLALLQRAVRVSRLPMYFMRMTLRRRAGERRPLVREGHVVNQVKVARLLTSVAMRADSLRLRDDTAAVVLPALSAGAERASSRARGALRRKLSATLERAGLSASSGLEQVARGRLIEELIDRILERGFISLPQLRDAVSRNDLKLPDVTEVPRDPLLAADALLSRTLMGVYRRGDIYLRALQKAMSYQFGTGFGRVLFLYLALPILGAFVLLEGAHHLLNPVLEKLGAPLLPPPEPTSLAVVAAVVFGLIHSRIVRTLARQLLDLFGLIIAWTLFHLPRALFAQPWMQRLLSRPLTRWVLRFLIIPFVVGALAFVAAPLPRENVALRLGCAGLGFVAASWLMGSRLGFWLEGFVVERLAPTWRVLGRRWLPELLRLIGRGFAALVDGMERGMARVEELLRARRRPRGPELVLLAMATGAWAIVAYVVRLYVTLLVEPELNPLKHFPVVTVAHKVLLPFLPALLHWVEKPFSILGPIVGEGLAGLTVFLLPSAFGFLVWELKENHRLYEATRPRNVQPARFGPHGETLRELLVIGLHSGTLPKYYERLRRAAQRSDERRQRARAAKRRAPPFSQDPELRRFRQKVRAIRIAVTRFIERELLPSIAQQPGWHAGALSVKDVELSSHRIRVVLSCSSLADEATEITFEQLGGHIVVGCSEPGFLPLLDSAQAKIVDNALAVFYHRADVQIVREQVAAELSPADYEIVRDGIAVYHAGRLQLTYPIELTWPRELRPRRHGNRWRREVPRLHARKVLYAHQPVAWSAWQQAFAEDAPEATDRLLSGPSLLPTKRSPRSVQASSDDLRVEASTMQMG